MVRRHLRAALPSLLLAAACSDGAIGPDLWPHLATLPLASCTKTRSFPVSLPAGAYASIDPLINFGCASFPANTSATDSAEYLVVAQSASGTPGVSGGFILRGDTVVVAAAAAASPRFEQPLSIAERFHDFLREMEARRWYGLPPVSPSPGAPPAGPPPPPAGPAAPPAIGDQRQFSVCAALDCSSFARITATALVVNGHIALYVDPSGPMPALTQTDLDSVADMFNSRLYAIDTTAFGRESDIDDNQVVIVLLTPVVNRLVTSAQCLSSGFVAGFFLGADLDPNFRNDSRFNHGEVFYTLVPDSLGALSCAHKPSAVKDLVPVTFIHEFQHMISFNQHVLVRGSVPEDLWLNEGMSHFAEELGGRSFGLTAPQFSTFARGDAFNAYQYLDAPGSHFLVPTSGIGTLAERGAAWLFVRYLADQFRTDTSFAAVAAFTRKLLSTSLTGATNVRTQTGVSFDTLAVRWALANYVSDLDAVLPGFTARPELRYTSWHFRTTYASLYAQDTAHARFTKPFPLLPTFSAGTAVGLSGTLRAGSGVYHRVLQAPGAPAFMLRFTDARDAMLSATIVARLDVIRIR